MRNQLLDKLFKEVAPRMLAKFDEIIGQNHGHIALGKVRIQTRYFLIECLLSFLTIY